MDQMEYRNVSWVEENLSGDGQRGRKTDEKGRRPLFFWEKFNTWWRAEHDRLDRRPTSIEIEAWYREKAQETWGHEAPTLDETRIHAKCLRTVAAVREYFAGYRRSKANLKEGVVSKRRHTMGHEFEGGMEGIGGIDYQLGNMLRMGLPSGMMPGPEGFQMDFMMANGAAMPFNLEQPDLMPPVLGVSQLQHSAAVAQQNTLNAISLQLTTLKNSKSYTIEDQDTKPLDDGSRAQRLATLCTMSRDELTLRIIELEDRLRKRDQEALELEEALEATNTSTGELREAVSALKQMSGYIVDTQ